MTAAGNLQVLPIWIWIVFTILLISIITFIYSQGNWRTTLAFTGLAIVTTLFIVGFDIWHHYLKTHFIGQFDALGIPFRQAGPGWSILFEAWPLWLVPTSFIVILALIIEWALHSFSQPKISLTTPKIKTNEPLQNISKQLELETLRQEIALTKEQLSTAVDITEEQINKNQILEVRLEQIQKQQQENLLDKEDKVIALTLEIEAKKTQNEELTALVLQQIEELIQLKNKLADLKTKTGPNR